ncbi:MAG: hemerythrin domain-containing protein [Planctomycetes bacterium]|nr:hemerythrin domain-containing protein [Planctomycetota bacterium]
MAVVTGTLSVNAAFLREIKEDNRRLHELWDETERLLASSPQEPSPRQVAEALGTLRDQLALHFSLEEAYGYFEDALDVAPRLSERAEELRSQHGALFLELCGIVERAEQWLYHETARDVLPAISRRYRRFLHALKEHETRETAMIMEALNDDVGVGD